MTGPHVYAPLNGGAVPICTPTAEPVDPRIVQSRPGCIDCDAEIVVARALKNAKEQGARIREERNRLRHLPQPVEKTLQFPATRTSEGPYYPRKGVKQ